MIFSIKLFNTINSSKTQIKDPKLTHTFLSIRYSILINVYTISVKPVTIFFLASVYTVCGKLNKISLKTLVIHVVRTELNSINRTQQWMYSTPQ